MKSLTSPHSPRRPLIRLLVISSLLSISFLLTSTAQIGSNPMPDNVFIANRTYTASANEAAGQSLSTYGAVNVSTSANVTFEAGKQVRLLPGFHAAAGSHFYAQIGLSGANLDRPSETDGAPVGLSLDTNHNGIPDFVERNLGLDPRANNDSDSRIQAMKANGSRNYTYDENNQLTNASEERAFANDPEGNISNH